MSAGFAIDSSALVAIMREEPEANDFLTALDGPRPTIGWPTILEIRLWVIRRGRDKLASWFEEFVTQPETIAVPFDEHLEALAADAFARFGKGMHPARLNFGDCMAYAVAKSHNVPLLFKGGDFGLTDLRIHPASVAL